MQDAENIIEVAKNSAEAVLEKAADKAEKLISEAAVSAAGILKDASEHVTNIKIMANDLGYVRQDVAEIKVKLESHYVTKDQFEPVKKIVYGLIGVLGVATLGAIFRLIFIK